MRRAVTAELETNTGLDRVQDWLAGNRTASLATGTPGGGTAILRAGVPLRAQRALSCRLTLQWDDGQALDGVLTAVASPYPGRPLLLSFTGRLSGEVSVTAGQAIAYGLLQSLGEPGQVAA